jgi:hypothetical protein
MKNKEKKFHVCLASISKLEQLTALLWGKKINYSKQTKEKIKKGKSIYITRLNFRFSEEKKNELIEIFQKLKIPLLNH